MPHVVPAVVHIGNMDTSAIVRNYYLHGGHDAIGPHCDLKAKTERHIVTFSSFEQLLDKLNSHGLNYHIVVCHGTKTEGLKIPFTAGVNAHTATGQAIGDLSKLADAVEDGERRNLDYVTVQMKLRDEVSQLSRKMGVNDEGVRRLVGKLVEVRKKKLVILIRGCNVGQNSAMLHDYYTALGTNRLFAPTVKNGFVPVNLDSQSLVAPQTLRTEQMQPNGAKVRRRSFPPRATPAELVIEVTDPGPGRFSSKTFTNNTASVTAGASQGNQGACTTMPCLLASKWGKELNREWNDARQEFVISVMWPTQTQDYYCVTDRPYTDQLALVM